MISLLSGTAARSRSSFARFAVLGLILGAAALLMPVCDDGGSSPAAPAPAPAPAPPPEPPEPETAQYTFAIPEVRISPRIPGTLPQGVDFYPELVLVGHGRDEAPFALDETASDALKILAEQGGSDELADQAEAEGMVVHARSFAELLQVFLSPDPSIELDSDRPCLSYAQMIAPSPDWFIGFTTVCATDEDGNWLDEISAELVAYDAGTAEGEDFQYKSGDTDPREPIALLDAAPYFVSPAVVQVLSATRKAE